MATKHWLGQKNIGADKMLALKKYSRCQNVGVDKILALTKCWRQQILALTKFPSRQNSWVDKMLAHARNHLLTVWSGRVQSSWLLSDLADVLLIFPELVDLSTCSRQVCRCHWPPCFYGRTLSCTVWAYCNGPPCRKCHKYWCQQNIGTHQDFTDFRQTIAVNISAHRCPT